MHPAIVFRDGPAGRRAGVTGGPDVWEIALWVDELAAGGGDASELVDDGLVTAAQLAAARAYRQDYPAEIDARIELHRLESTAVARR